VRAKRYTSVRETVSNMETLETLTIIRAPIDRCFDLARSVEVHLAGNIHCGQQTVAAAGVTSGMVGLGEHVTWRARHFLVWRELTSEITQMERPVHFQDVMIDGIFRMMRHDHYFRSPSPAETEMRGVFSFAAPLPVLGRLAEIALLRRYMRNLLRERNAAIKEIAESNQWVRYLP
jgi:ligand-binding SRPBCC domain-containing protein